MNTAKEVLERLKRRRQCEEAVERLRRRTQRNTPVALFYFAVALVYVWQAWRFGITQTIEGKSVFLAGGVGSLGIALIWVVVGIQRVWVSPSDRLLLLLAEDSLMRKEEPNQALPLSVRREMNTIDKKILDDWPIDDLSLLKTEPRFDEHGAEYFVIFSKRLDVVTAIGSLELSKLKALGLKEIAKLPK